MDDKTHTQQPSEWNAFFRNYKMTEALTSLALTKRASHLLDWAAKHGPGVVIPYNVIYRHIMGFGHTPRVDNKDVERFAKSLTACRPYLQKRFGRDLKKVPYIGARATVDSLDVVKSTMPTAVRRVNSAHASLEKASKLVDTNKLPTAGADRGWTEWYSRTVTPALRALANDDRINRLLPPAVTEQK